MSEFNADAIWQRAPLPWQTERFELLVDMNRQDRLPHALLVSGPQGSGKRVFVAAFAAYLLCRNSAFLPCGICEGCQLAAGGGHGDYRWIAPDSEKNKKTIGIDAIRTAIDFIQRTPGYGDRKVLAVSPAQAMTTSAANALLKTLEEPAGNSFICLVTSRPGDLPATVRSRCQSLTLNAPSTESAIDWLQGVSQVAATNAQEALTMANGQAMSALSLLNDGGLDEQRALTTLIAGLLVGSRGVANTSAELGRFDADVILASLAAGIENAAVGVARRANNNSIASTRQLFDLYSDVQRWQRALRSGTNPNKDLLLAEVCNRASGVLRA